MSNYTLRIWTNGDGAFEDQDFETLAQLYNSIIDGWTPENLKQENAKVNLSSGWAVYDNAHNECISSVNAQQIGLDKTQPWQQQTV